MDSRVVLDALSPTPATFAAAATAAASLDVAGGSIAEHLRDANPSLTAPCALRSLPTLRQTLKQSFPPPPASPLPPDLSRLIRVTSLPQLQRAILHARARRRRVRASTGGLASSSNRRALAQGAYVLDVSPLNKCVFHATRAVVVAQAGVSLRDLHALATARGFSQQVHVPLSSRARSVGAVLAAGGTGGEGLLADAVLEISFVDAFGRLRVFSGKGDGEVFVAAKVSLGMFGVVYDTTIKVDPVKRVAWVCNRFLPLRGFVESEPPRAVQKLVESGVGVEVTWMPFNSYRQGQSWVPEEDALWLRFVERVAENAKRHAVQVEDVNDVAFRFLTIPQWLSLNCAALVKHGYSVYRPEHCKLFHGVAFAETAWKLETKPFAQSLAHAVQYQHNAETSPLIEVCIVLPLRHGKEEDWAVVQAAWRVVLRHVRECDERGEYPLNVAMKTAFVKSSQALLAPNFVQIRRGTRNAYSACVRLLSAKNSEGWQKFARKIIHEWMALPGARCELGGALREIVSPDQVASSFGEGLERFLAMRQKACVDDYGMFVEEDMGELLGIQGECEDMCSSPVSSAGSWRSPKGFAEDDAVWAEMRNAEMHRYDGRTSGATLNVQRLETRSSTPRSWVPFGRGSCSHTPSSDKSGPCGTSPLPAATYAELGNGSRVAQSEGGSSGGVAEEDMVRCERTVVWHMWERKRKIERRTRHRRILTGGEFSLLYAYLLLYAVLWGVLFGRQALQRVGVL